MSDRIELKPVHPEHAGATRPVAMDIVFIHGLGGDWEATWRFDEHRFWPSWLADAHPQVQVWCLGYPAKVGHLASLGSSTQPGSSQLATAALAHLRDNGIVLLCHKRSLAFTRRQHGHLGSVLSKAAAIRSRKLVMDDGTWHCVCGAAARLVMCG